MISSALKLEKEKTMQPADLAVKISFVEVSLLTEDPLNSTILSGREMTFHIKIREDQVKIKSSVVNKYRKKYQTSSNPNLLYSTLPMTCR